MTTDRQITIEQQRGVTVIRPLARHLTSTMTITDLEDQLFEFLQREQPGKVVFSFEGVAYCSTNMINTVLRAKKRVVEYGGELRLCVPDDSLRKVYRVLKLDGTAFQIHDSLDQAIWEFTWMDGSR